MRKNDQVIRELMKFKTKSNRSNQQAFYLCMTTFSLGGKPQILQESEKSSRETVKLLLLPTVTICMIKYTTT